MSNYLKVAWTLSMLVAICGVLVGMADLPVAVLVVVAIVSGFWWAFGRGFTGEAEEGRGRQRDRG
jgi:glucose uptake protein GlcU